MNLLKTPHEKLMEDAGLAPQSPGMLNTPRQLLMQEVGGMPHFAAGGQMFGQNKSWAFGQNAAPAYVQGVPPPQHHADGGSTTMSPQDMLASLVASGHLPAHYAPGGSVEHYFKGSSVKNMSTQAAFTLPFADEELTDIAKHIKQKQYTPAAIKTGLLGYSAFAPFNPLTAFIYGITESDEVGAGSTLDEYNKRKEEESAKYRAQLQQTSPVFRRPEPMTPEQMQDYALGYPNMALPPVKPYPAIK